MGTKMEFKSEIIQAGDLTPREIEVVRCVCDAMTDKQIARVLAISLHTVANHIENIHTKLGIRQGILNKRVALLRLAMQHGLVRVLCLVLWSLPGSAWVAADYPLGVADYYVPPPVLLEAE